MTTQKKSAALELEDALSDFANGFRVWRDSKIGRGRWTDEDEAFLRWVEASPHDLV
jgi:hypothetical protein